MIIEIIYLHKHNPDKLPEHLTQEINIRKMLIYNIIDDDYKPYCGNIGLLVKIVHKIGAVFVYWSKLVHK